MYVKELLAVRMQNVNRLDIRVSASVVMDLKEIQTIQQLVVDHFQHLVVLLQIVELVPTAMAKFVDVNISSTLFLNFIL